MSTCVPPLEFVLPPPVPNRRRLPNQPINTIVYDYMNCCCFIHYSGKHKIPYVNHDSICNGCGNLLLDEDSSGKLVRLVTACNHWLHDRCFTHLQTSTQAALVGHFQCPNIIESYSPTCQTLISTEEEFHHTVSLSVLAHINNSKHAFSPDDKSWIRYALPKGTNLFILPDAHIATSATNAKQETDNDEQHM